MRYDEPLVEKWMRHDEIKMGLSTLFCEFWIYIWINVYFIMWIWNIYIWELIFSGIKYKNTRPKFGNIIPEN